MHHTNELIFERPAILTDRTAHILAVGAEGPSPFTVVVTRTRVEPGETLAAMVDRIEAALAASLEGYRRTERGETAAAGQDAVLLRFQWLQNGHPLFQKQVALVADLAEGRTLIQIAATATAEATPEHAAAFDALLASLKLREPAAA